MTKRLVIMVVGLALMVGLYVYDRDNRTELVFAATVTAIDARDTEAGPDSWHVTIIGPSGETELEALEKRPDLDVGQETCVKQITRAQMRTEYIWAPSESC